jgi:hypothetical protein
MFHHHCHSSGISLGNPQFRATASSTKPHVVAQSYRLLEHVASGFQKNLTASVSRAIDRVLNRFECGPIHVLVIGTYTGNATLDTVVCSIEINYKSLFNRGRRWWRSKDIPSFQRGNDKAP